MKEFLKEYKGFVIVGAILLVVAVFWFATPAGVSIRNNWMHSVKKADDATNYNTLKEVEDTCRGMISSYKSDKVIYDQYKDSEDKEEQSWAANAKIRANQTAIKYNEYYLKNSYIWEDNIPSDINTTLEILE